MAVLTSLVLLCVGAAFAGETYTDCATEDCAGAPATYTADGDTYDFGECAGAGWFFKNVGDLKKDNGQFTTLKDFCKSKGYDTAGEMWRFSDKAQAVRPNGLADFTDPGAVAAMKCNKHSPYDLIRTFGSSYYWHGTWECVTLPDTYADCCVKENWTAECYTKRVAGNKYHTCSSCGPPPGPCALKCDGNVLSDACFECCRDASHEEDWKCDRVGSDPKDCKDISDPTECGDAAHCKVRQKRGVFRKCMRQKCRKLDNAACASANKCAVLTKRGKSKCGKKTRGD